MAPNGIDIENGVLRSYPPSKPGVYIFKDASGHVIYVGKAKNLKKRVLSYFRAGADASQKTASMINRARGLDYILTATENEAFILESSLIKGYMPRYNVILRDDKQYPCIRLDLNETYPRLNIVRRIKKDGAVYFGPFSSSHSVRESIRLIDRIFPLRKCKTGTLRKRIRPCLNFQMGRCLGPCSNKVPLSAYMEIVAQVRLFLEGRNRELLRKLERDMRRLSDMEDYEGAARIRDRIIALKKTVERQHVVSASLEDLDVIGIAFREDIYQLVIQFIRKGYLTGSRNYSFKNTSSSSSEVMESFLKQYYSKSIFLPKKILISEDIEDPDSIAEWISGMSGKKVSIIRPVRGEKVRMIDMAVSNAEDALLRTEEKTEEDIINMTRSTLGLEKMPAKIECMDISNLQGGMAVGTVASFIDGKPNKDGYRNYRIRGVEGINDYEMMSELVIRHLKVSEPPDLLVLDGGKGHLLTVTKAIKEVVDCKKMNVISIAKADRKKGETSDKIFIKGRKNPLVLRSDHPVLLLLMRIRDEAHRRAISYHRKLRDETMKRSLLDLIPGIGTSRKRNLLNRFGDIDSISRAKPEELALVKGISLPLAQSIASFFLMETRKNSDKME
ncbi:MAG: excinuclease ABC subunit UvrC [Deltaproteobacteria bacterium]|nr:excinuclease ABC subunit UvrC [Deltaproteobacteria bacterium]